MVQECLAITSEWAILVISMTGMHSRHIMGATRNAKCDDEMCPPGTAKNCHGQNVNDTFIDKHWYKSPFHLAIQNCSDKLSLRQSVPGIVLAKMVWLRSDSIGEELRALV